jgi:hypothetical protein
LDICEACEALQLPPAIGAQFLETKLRKLHPWQASCLGAVLEAEDEDRSAQYAASLGGSLFPAAPPNLVYCAPTSGGKTLVAVLLLLRRVVLTGGRALYVLPLRATVVEKVNELTALVRPYNQALAPEDRARHTLVVQNAGTDDAKGFRASTANVLVCTVEKANLVLNDLLLAAADEHDRATAGFSGGGGTGSSHSAAVGVAAVRAPSPSQSPPLVTVVVDEVHYLAEKVPLEMLLTKLTFIRAQHAANAAAHRRSAASANATAGGAGGGIGAAAGPELCQVIAFSATLPNAAELAAWLGSGAVAGHSGGSSSGGGCCVLYQAVDRPTPLDLLVACGNGKGLLSLPQVDALLADAPPPATSGNAASLQATLPGGGKGQGGGKGGKGKGGKGGGSGSGLGLPESNDAEQRRFVALVLQRATQRGKPGNPSSSGDSSGDSDAEGVLVFCGTKHDCEVDAEAIAKARAARSGGGKSSATGNGAAAAFAATAVPLPAAAALRAAVALPLAVAVALPSTTAAASVAAVARRAARKALERLEVPPGTDPALRPKLLALLAHGVAFYHAPMPQVTAIQ